MTKIDRAAEEAVKAVYKAIADLSKAGAVEVLDMIESHCAVMAEALREEIRELKDEPE